MADALLRLKNLEKSYGDTKVLNGVSLDVLPGEFVTLLGPSGCGKTTTLRIIAGLMEPDHGSVELAGQDITFFPPEKRNVNTVFQNYALFPHMNVEKNIEYGLKLRGVSKQARREQVRKMLRLVRLEGYEKRMPFQLSGGQRQRVAIARSVVLNPGMLLLDEPLGALDLKLRRQMQLELKEIQQTLGIAFVYITHDQEEALNMSDRIAVMREGRIEQEGTPQEIYEHPQTPFVAEFIGQTNFLKCRVARVAPDRLYLRYGDVELPARRDDMAAQPGDAVLLCLRMERVRLARQRQGACAIQGKLESLRYAGVSMRAEVRLLDGQEIAVQCPSLSAAPAKPGESVWLCWDPEETAVVRGDEHAGA